MTRHWTLTAMALLSIVLAGCASKDVLELRSAIVPAGVDIGGQWQLRNDSRDTNQRLVDAELTAAGGNDNIYGSSRRQSRKSKNRGSLVHVFLEYGVKLKITQTEYGLFISFDRAVVEEYRFGESRPINVGPVQAQRSSGWEEGAYIIETLDTDGNKLYERYQLEDNGQMLIRQITIWKNNAVHLSLVQKFDKV